MGSHTGETGWSISSKELALASRWEYLRTGTCYKKVPVFQSRMITVSVNAEHGSYAILREDGNQNSFKLFDFLSRIGMSISPTPTNIAIWTHNLRTFSIIMTWTPLFCQLVWLLLLYFHRAQCHARKFSKHDSLQRDISVGSRSLWSMSKTVMVTWRSLGLK